MGEHLTSGPFSEITGIVSYFHDYQRISGWGVGYGVGKRNREFTQE